MANNIIFLVLCLVIQCYGQNSYFFENHKYCDDLSSPTPVSPYPTPYHEDINLEQISGIWYGVEKIPHTKGEYRIDYTQECFYIDIKEQYIQPTPPTPYPPLANYPYVNQQFITQEPYRIRYFILEWHEGIRVDNYHLKVNTSHKGFWQTDIPDTSVENMYRYFGGVIQVLKVANNHLVLNFCMRLPESKLFSVVLSRNENQLTPEDLASIHNVFTMKHLSTSSLKRVCENSASSLTISSILIVTVGWMIWASRA